LAKPIADALVIVDDQDMGGIVGEIHANLGTCF
jgi:hypothetical protein